MTPYGLSRLLMKALAWSGFRCLTVRGHAVSVLFGDCRQMLGIHYRFDGIQGLILGETITVRTLHQVSILSRYRSSALHNDCDLSIP